MPAAPRRSPTTAKRPWLPLMLALLAVTAAGSWAAQAFLHRAPERLAKLQAQALPRQSSAAARETLERSPELGEACIAVLVAGMTDERPEVAYRAADVLREEVIQWCHARTAASEQALQRVAAELAAQLEDFSPASRAEASRLADVILQTSPPRNTERPLETLIACESLLRANLAAREEPATAETAAVPAAGAAEEVER